MTRLASRFGSGMNGGDPIRNSTISKYEKSLRLNCKDPAHKANS